MDNIIALYVKTFAAKGIHIEKLPQAGSNRKYFRLFSENAPAVIGVYNDNKKENECFVSLAEHFLHKGLNVPAIYAFDESHTVYLQEDLGNISLYSSLSSARENHYTYTETDLKLLTKVIRHLPRIQIEGAKDLDFKQCISPIEFNHQTAMFDLNYFKYNFFKTTHIPYDEVALEDELQRFADELTQNDHLKNYFLYRDFQSRNIMLKEGIPYFIDFQGGMSGPLEYDVSSFLWQSSAKFTDEVRNTLIRSYVEEVKSLIPDFNEYSFLKRLKKFVFFRILQVLGAYGLRGYVERKPYFIQSIPNAIYNLHQKIEEGVIDSYPYFKEVLLQVCALPQFQLVETQKDSPLSVKGKFPLIVQINSFSYKKGIPEDTSGNGGGYVFDCRGVHNPGRYESYRNYTGLDEPVIQFLEKDGEILDFLKSVYTLADSHVKRYLERGFTHLMFSFGCTGGQHRSVYSAQHLAEYLHNRYGIEVHICHREQNITQILHSK